MPFSVRLDRATEAKIRRLARATGRTKSAVVREAMAQYGTSPAAELEASVSALDRLKPFIGVVATSGQFSERTHEKYRASLRCKHRARRTR